jgi:quinol monooxygenase YgiN
MAVAMLAEIPGLTQEQYERVVKTINQTGTPAGALVHAAGPVEDGYRVLEVWDNQQAADAFYNSAGYRAATANLGTEPKLLMSWPVEGLDVGSGWQPMT